MQTTSILVVEDDAGLREALCDTLSLANYQVVPALDLGYPRFVVEDHCRLR